MLRKIRLYGALAEFVGHRELEAKASTVGEAIRFLLCNWPALEQHMAEQYYKIEIGDWNVRLEEIGYPAGSEPIRIIPVVEGAGGNEGIGVGSIAIGAALIGVAIASGGAGFALGSQGIGFIGITSASAAAAPGIAALGNIGVAMILGGVASVMTPVPQTPIADSDSGDSSRQASNTFSRVGQTAQAGTAIPVIYGEVFTGSVVISAKSKINLDEGDED